MIYIQYYCIIFLYILFALSIILFLTDLLTAILIEFFIKTKITSDLIYHRALQIIKYIYFSFYKMQVFIIITHRDKGFNNEKIKDLV